VVEALKNIQIKAPDECSGIVVTEGIDKVTSWVNDLLDKTFHPELTQKITLGMTLDREVGPVWDSLPDKAKLVVIHRFTKAGWNVSEWKLFDNGSISANRLTFSRPYTSKEEPKVEEQEYDFTEADRS